MEESRGNQYLRPLGYVCNITHKVGFCSAIGLKIV